MGLDAMVLDMQHGMTIGPDRAGPLAPDCQHHGHCPYSPRTLERTSFYPVG